VKKNKVFELKSPKKKSELVQFITNTLITLFGGAVILMIADKGIQKAGIDVNAFRMTTVNFNAVILGVILFVAVPMMLVGASFKFSKQEKWRQRGSRMLLVGAGLTLTFISIMFWEIGSPTM